MLSGSTAISLSARLRWRSSVRLPIAAGNSVKWFFEICSLRSCDIVKISGGIAEILLPVKYIPSIDFIAASCGGMASSRLKYR